MPDIKVKGFSGTDLVYQNVDKVYFRKSDDSGTVPFSYGDAVDNIPISLNFANGEDQTITAPDGTLVRSAVIEKPENLVEENIAEGAEICGVKGKHKGGDHFITYMSEDGTETFLVKPVMHGDSCGDIVALDFIEKPVKESTETAEYIFNGWAASIGGEADDSLLTSVTEDKTVYAAFETVAITASGTFASGAAWRLNERGTFTVCGEGAIDTYAADTDRPWHNHIGNIKTLTIEDGVTGIGDRAFMNATALDNVNIPDSVTSIGSRVFRGCTALTSATVPDGLTSIPVQMYYLCSNLSSITIPDSVISIGDYALNGCGTTGGFSIYYEGDLAQWFQVSKGTSWGSTADWYTNGEKIADTIIPDDVTEIPTGAFKYCGSLQSVTIPDSVTTIGASAFSQCASLASATIGNGVTSIPSGLFGWCPALTSIIIPDSVTSIGSSAFTSCTSLSSVTIGSGVTSIGLQAFLDCKALTSIDIPNAVKDIGQQAFGRCSALESVTIGSGVTHIDIACFALCTNLTSATFRDTTTWYATQTAGATSGTSLSSSNLANTSTAATYLVTTYNQYHFYKK